MDLRELRIAPPPEKSVQGKTLNIFTLAKGATHIHSANNIHWSAFTLAEVLITLGIIGVVAAMTIPSIINSTQKKELVAQYKKVYSSISQAYLMMQNDNGGTIEGLCSSENDYIELFSKYMNNVKTCKTTEEDLNSCFTRTMKTPSGGSLSSDIGSSLITADGAQLLFYHISSSCTGTTELKKPIGCARIRVDVNGEKKPNTISYDIFDFYLTQNGVLPRGHEDTNADTESVWGKGILILTKGKIDW